MVRNIIRSPILAGNITSDCGPLGRHYRATMFRAGLVNYMSVSTSWQLLKPTVLLSVNSFIPHKSDYNKTNGNWFR